MTEDGIAAPSSREWNERLGSLVRRGATNYRAERLVKLGHKTCLLPLVLPCY